MNTYVFIRYSLNIEKDEFVDNFVALVRNSQLVTKFGTDKINSGTVANLNLNFQRTIDQVIHLQLFKTVANPRRMQRLRF